MNIFELLGKIVIWGGGTSVIAYFILKTIGKKWLDEKFKFRLLEFENLQKTEFRRFELELDKLFNRVIKIHQQEFVVLPKAWKKLNDAHGRLMEIIHPFKTYPDLDRMTRQELDKFLGTSKLHDFQKDELREQKEKLKYYQEKIYWIDYNELYRSIQKFHNYIILNKIFFSKDLFNLFSQIDGKLSQTYMLSCRLGERTSNPDAGGVISKYFDEAPELIDKLGSMIQERLHFEEAK